MRSPQFKMRVCFGHAFIVPQNIRSMQITRSIAGKKKSSSTLHYKADPTEHSWRGVLRGHVPSKSLSADSEIPVPMLLGTGRRWVRKATAFRGRSEQDRSALCPACCTGVLKTFRWNVFNEISFSEIGGTQRTMSRQTIHRCRSLPQLQPNFEKSLTLFQKKAILKCIRVYPDSKRRCAGRGFLFWGSVSWQSNGSNNWKKY